MDMGLLGGEKLIVGYDLGNLFSQISFAVSPEGEVETLSQVAGGQVYNIPTVLCRKHGTSQWFYGREAIRSAREDQGVLVENLLDLALEGEQVAVDGEVYDPVALLTLFFKRSLGMLPRPVEKITALMITCPVFNERVRQGFSQGAGLPASPPHFVILGTAPGLPEVLEAHARRMKSLRWFLLEAEWGEELSAFVEDFYTEYGLAIELRLLEDGAALKRLRLFCGEPVIVVDFTGESYMAVPAVPEGSVWLDMFSVEEKRRRILARGKDITYFSMKEIWKNAQKRCNCPVLP